MKILLIILLIIIAIPVLIFMCTVGTCSYRMSVGGSKKGTRISRGASLGEMVK